MNNLSMKNLVSAAILASVPLMATSALAEVVYQNDFATRVSTGAVPYGDWREQPYVTGKYLNTAAEIFYGSVIQDGWILAREQNLCPTEIFGAKRHRGL